MTRQFAAAVGMMCTLATGTACDRDTVQDNGSRDRGDMTGTSGEAAAIERSVEEAGERTAAAVSDSFITAKVQSKYFLDDEVKSRRIDVDTTGGIVTVRGSVGSFEERQKAVALARGTDGVREVRDELKVDPGIERDRNESTSDEWITTTLQSRYFQHDRLRPSDVDVSVNDGVVTLTGTVRSADAREAAETLARETEGVTRVENRINVAAQPLSGAS